MGCRTAYLEAKFGSLDAFRGMEEHVRAAGHRLGIRGVPYFVFNQAPGISGAQPAEVLAAAMEQACGQY
jgi:predicted DsbA family dithiol-disulfide isomerase